MKQDYNERRLRRFVDDLEELLAGLTADMVEEDLEQTNVGPADIGEPRSEAGGSPRQVSPKASNQVSIPPSLVVVDEAKKAKR